MPHRTRPGRGLLRSKDSGKHQPGHARTFVAALLGSFVLGAACAPLVAAREAVGPPVNSAPPAVKGTALDGKKLKASAGTWNGSKPYSYSYAWQLCDASGGGCSGIPSAASSVLVTESQDVGHTLRAVVTAKNAEGSSLATSAPSAKITPAPPRRARPRPSPAPPRTDRFSRRSTGPGRELSL